MRIIGIDPGTYHTGYGIIEEYKGNHKVVAFGSMDSKDPQTSLRYREIYNMFTAVVQEYKPDVCAIESSFFSKNPKVLMRLAEIRGVLILAASLAGIEIFEYSPLEVKKSVVGNGRADKSQVHKMVKAILNLDKIPGANDVSDALAISLCHAHNKNSFKLKALKNI